MLQGMAATRHSPLQVDHSVPVGSQSHGCWVAVILSSWGPRAVEGHLVGWGLGLGFFKKKMAQPGDSFAPWGSEASLGSLCVEPGMKSNVTRGIQNPMLFWGGAGAGQQDVTLGS